MGEVVMFTKREIPAVQTNPQTRSYLGGMRIDGTESRFLTVQGTTRKFALTTRLSDNPHTCHTIDLDTEGDKEFRVISMYLDDEGLKHIAEHIQRYFAMKAEKFMQGGYPAIGAGD